MNVNLYIEELVNSAPKLTATDTDQALYALYETNHGIFNHINGPNKDSQPLAMVAMHESENNTSDTTLYEQIELYLKLDVYKNTGLNLNDFLDLPREFIIHLYNLLKVKNQHENTEAAKINNALGDLGK